jgi:hypothetical protein
MACAPLGEIKCSDGKNRWQEWCPAMWLEPDPANDLPCLDYSPMTAAACGDGERLLPPFEPR